ncbi:hypothetical protein HALLA_19615 [Halostagnicola larsenii XH-48]|uniref:DUF7847 domain-containing protein n=1 Tax=Halostagnicola larsenii XH-48 TaxID=797299 RepID=W0JV99_9EURY|nr:hypothetical protein [Halostagnicola larsenii]AHG01200.1 hypothetical protein HALLA_19615 [Halostagnicola larsenii XH-48]
MDYTSSMTRSTSTVDDATTGDVAPTIKARDDVDGCGCLECRNIETVTTRRTVLDALVWSLRLFRSHPSIVAFAGMGILANRLLETNSINTLPTPAIGVFDAITAFTFLFLIRAYVGTIVAGALTGDTVTIRDGLHRSITRIPALIGVIVLFILSVMTIPFLVSLPLLVLIAVVPGNPVEIVGFPVAGAVGVIVVTVPFLLLLFKFWFAPEACVVGRYAPVEALRISWRITTNYRGKFVLILVIAIGTAISFYLPTYLPDMGTKLAWLHPVLRVISASFGEFLSIVWASAYAHIYVQEVVS